MRQLWMCVGLLLCSQEAFGLVPEENLHDAYKYLIENTTWIVPPSTLLAYQYVSGTAVAVTDQTVWTIGSYEGGFFTGTAYTGINGTATLPPAKQMLGTITNSGDVY